MGLYYKQTMQSVSQLLSSHNRIMLARPNVNRVAINGQPAPPLRETQIEGNIFGAFVKPDHFFMRNSHDWGDSYGSESLLLFVPVICFFGFFMPCGRKALLALYSTVSKRKDDGKRV